MEKDMLVVPQQEDVLIRYEQEGLIISTTRTKLAMTTEPMKRTRLAMTKSASQPSQ